MSGRCVALFYRLPLCISSMICSARVTSNSHQRKLQLILIIIQYNKTIDVITNNEIADNSSGIYWVWLFAASNNARHVVRAISECTVRKGVRGKYNVLRSPAPRCVSGIMSLMPETMPETQYKFYVTGYAAMSLATVSAWCSEVFCPFVTFLSICNFFVHL